MNRFEALGAPPTLSTKELSMHMKMIPSSVLSPELRTQYGGDLLKPKVRLYDELTTLRFTLTQEGEAEDKLYRKACKLLTHASGEPIPYRFFRQEFLRLLEECGCSEQSAPSELSARLLNNAIGSIGDIWLYQAYAALFLRIAENSETSDPKNAPRAWHAALNAYQRFFAEARVEDSVAYRVQTEEKFRQDCRDAWNGFLAEQVEGVYRRMRGYIQQCSANRVSACMQTLQLSTAGAIQPGLFERAAQDSLELYARAIRSAPSLRLAAEMFDRCPKELLDCDEENQCKGAILGAIKAAVERFTEGASPTDSTKEDGARKRANAGVKKSTAQGSAAGSDIDLIIDLDGKLDFTNLYANGAASLRKEMKELFESVAEFSRTVVNNDRIEFTREYEFLMAILPPDHMVGLVSGVRRYPDYFVGDFIEKSVRQLASRELYYGIAERQARILGNKVQALIDQTVPKKAFRKIALGKASSAWIDKLEFYAKNDEAFQAGIEAFPDDWPIAEVTTKTFRSLRKTAQSVELENEAISLLEAARNAKTGTADEEEKLRALIVFACDHPAFDMNQDGACFPMLMDLALAQALVCNYNKRMELANDEQCLKTMRICAGFLPECTYLPSDAGKSLWPVELVHEFGFDRDELLQVRREDYEKAFEQATHQILPRLDATKTTDLIWKEVIHLKTADSKNPPESPESKPNEADNKTQNEAQPPKQEWFDEDEDEDEDENENENEDEDEDDEDDEPKQREQRRPDQAPRAQRTPQEPERSNRKRRRVTRLNGIRFRGGNVAAGIQYFLLAMFLPWMLQYGAIRLLVRWRSSPYLLALVATALAVLWLALVVNGVFGLLSNSDNPKTAGFGKAARAIVWLAAILTVLAFASAGLWPESLLLRIVLCVYALISLFVAFHQIHQNAYFSSSTITLDGIPYAGGGIAVFFKYVVVQLMVPCIVASLIYLFRWQLTPGWIFGFQLCALALLFNVIRAFYICLAEDERFERFAKFMAAESFLLMPPALGGYAIWYFKAVPLEWWVIVILAVYGLFFLFGTILATRLER